MENWTTEPNLKGLLKVTKEWSRKNEAWCGKTREKYGNAAAEISDTQHKIAVGGAGRLAITAMEKGANDEEGERLIRHFWVCMNARKDRLDFEAYRRNNGIAELARKYDVRLSFAE